MLKSVKSMPVCVKNRRFPKFSNKNAEGGPFQFQKKATTIQLFFIHLNKLPLMFNSICVMFAVMFAVIVFSCFSGEVICPT